jgi:hypothetical protein
VRQPNKNFAPQLGLAWDPTKQHKTVIRAGFGIYYDTALYNNVIFDRTDRLEKGLFLGLQNLARVGPWSCQAIRFLRRRCPQMDTRLPPKFAVNPLAA